MNEMNTMATKTNQQESLKNNGKGKGHKANISDR